MFFKKKKVEDNSEKITYTVEVSDLDRLDFNFVLTGLNTVMSQVTKALPPEITDEETDTFYTVLFEKFKELKIKEHKLRVKFMGEYDIPYAWGYNDGVITYEEANEE